MLIFLLLFTSCSDDPPSPLKQNLFAERIERTHDTATFFIPPPEKQPPPHYPWQERRIGKFPRITKEFFRCRGSALNPIRYEVIDGEKKRIEDCGGAERHSLPLNDGVEFIYPILIDLMNRLQATTQKRVVITSGHRCPIHNSYVDNSRDNRTSKHQVGAEVSFYIQGMEWEPQKVVDLLMSYYQEREEKEWREFNRYLKEDTNVSTPPWYNKEIFIKLFKDSEGRNFDNRHPYPYIAIQVRYDPEKKRRVFYSWEGAHQNYLRR